MIFALKLTIFIHIIGPAAINFVVSKYLNIQVPSMNAPLRCLVPNVKCSEQGE